MSKGDMSKGGLALLVSAAVVAVLVGLKIKIQNLENQIRILNSRINGLVSENTALRNIIAQKESENATKDAEITRLKKQGEKN